MRIEDLERLVAAHSKMCEAVKTFVGRDGDVSYYYSDSRDAISALAKRISLETGYAKTQPEVAPPAPSF